MSHRKEMGRFIVRPIIILVLFLLLFAAFIHPSSPASFNLGSIRSHVDALGYWGPLYYMLAVVILELFSFPMVPLIMLAGILFGKAGGAAAAIAAATLSAQVSWFVARYMIHGELREKVLFKLDKFAPFLIQKGLFHIAMSRSLPVPFGIVSYATGVLYADFRTVALGNIIGIAPWCVIYTWLSSELVENKLIIIGALLAVIIVLEILLFLYWQKQNTAGMYEAGSGVSNSHETN